MKVIVSTKKYMSYLLAVTSCVQVCLINRFKKVSSNATTFVKFMCFSATFNQL